MKRLYATALLCAVLFSGCSEAEEKNTGMSETAKQQEQKIEQKTEEQSSVETAVSKSIEVDPQTDKFYTIFKDSAKIATDGKKMLLVFGQDGDPYTKKIQNDIVTDEELAKKIKETVTPIYIDARGQKQHKFQHNGQMMDVDTKTLVGIYDVTATPTLIFTDSQASHIFVVPGYMPPKQFKVTLSFVEQELWRGLDRKNGEVYEALKKFYEENGVEIKGAEK